MIISDRLAMLVYISVHVLVYFRSCDLGSLQSNHVVHNAVYYNMLRISMHKAGVKKLRVRCPITKDMVLNSIHDGVNRNQYSQ